VIEFAVKNAWLVAVLPFLAATIITLFTLKHPVLSSRISRVAVILSLILSCIIGYAAITDINSVIQSSSGSLRWFTTGEYDFSIGWKVDAITAMMLFVVTLISSLIQIYSREYMEEYLNKGFSRYFAQLSFFTFSMLLLVLADNLLVLYMGWELVGVSSYMLIGFFFEKQSAAIAAKKAMLTNRVGDFGFLLGILIIFTYVGSLNFDVIASKVLAGQIGGFVLTGAAICLFIGAIGKSGQFPLHVWLPDAMEGPTPVSALIHAATMVTAGVYMVAKIMPIFAQAMFPIFGINALTFVGIIGGITAIMAAFIAITQNDIKRVLAYSTVSQLGFMMLALGMYTTPEGKLLPIGYTAAIFHLFTHAFFKAMLFLCSGSVIHATHTQDIREMGGLRKFLPITSITFLIGTATISGFPLLAGFWSKDEILSATFAANMPLFVIACIAATLTAFYMFRLYFVSFEGQYRGHGTPHEPGWRMTFPLVFLSIPCLLVGFIGTPWANFFGKFIYYVPVEDSVYYASLTGSHHPHEANFVVMGISLLIFLIGFGLAYFIYRKDLEMAKTLSKKMGILYKASLNKLYFDELYSLFIKYVVLLLSKGIDLFDKYFIDLIVNAVSWLCVMIGHVVKFVQTGKVQHYALAILMAVFLNIVVFNNTKSLGFVTKNYVYGFYALAVLVVAGLGYVIYYNRKNKVFD